MRMHNMHAGRRRSLRAPVLLLVAAMLASTDHGRAEAAKEKKIKEFLDSFDTDGDGKIQKSEWLAFFGQLFDSVIEAGLSQ